MMAMTRQYVVGAILPLAAVLAAMMLMAAPTGAEAGPHPFVFFPGYGFSVLEVTVTNQSTEPTCNQSGTYELYFEARAPQNGFDITCMTNLLALHYNVSQDTFSAVPGVSAVLKNYGHPSCAPYYEPLWQGLEDAGLARNSTLLAACYDWRVTPNVDVIDGSHFMNDTRDLILRAYEASGGMKVYLSGHSNGPIMAQYFLLHIGADFRDQYIAGFIPFAGNWAGGGLVTSLLWEGLSVLSFDFLPTAAATFEAWPSTYFSASQPAVFKNSITIISTPERNYTSEDYDQLWSDSGLTLAPILNPKFNGLVTPDMFPEVPVFNFYGSNITTYVGVGLPNFTLGVPPTKLYTAMGDINQEYIDNESNKIWSQMECYPFIDTEMPNVSHFMLPINGKVVNATVAILQASTPGNLCSGASSLFPGSLMSLFL